MLFERRPHSCDSWQNSGLYSRSRKFGGLFSFFQRAPARCSISWFFAPPSTLRSASCWTFVLELLVGLLQLLLLVCSSPASCWGLLQQPFCPCMVAFDAVEQSLCCR